MASGRKTTTLKHQDSVSDIVFSRDGRWVATASSDKTARLWQVADGKELARLPHPDPVQSLFFGADGRLLVTLSRRDDKLLLRLWSLPEGRETRLIEPPRQMLDFVLSDSGRYLVGRMPAGQIAPALVWDLSSGEQVASLSAGNGVIHSMATHGDVLALAEWGSSRAMVSLWRLGSWAPLGQVQGLRGSTVLALSADAGLLVGPNILNIVSTVSRKISRGEGAGHVNEIISVAKIGLHRIGGEAASRRNAIKGVSNWHF